MAHITATPSACLGANCPLDYGPTPVFAAAITPTPTLTAQFTPPPECLDPGNIWIVTTSCYIESPDSIQGTAVTPPWLQCSVTNFGAPDWGDPSCYVSTNSKTTQAAETLFYDGCPSGYTPVMTWSGAGYDTYEHSTGYFDITYYSTGCCPTQYSFQYLPWEVGQSITTVHDQTTYGVFVYPPPRCYATSVDELSGKDIPMHTTSNDMAWDRKRQEPDFPTTTLWDYERATLLAQLQVIGNTVFEGTHTCYESCSTWFSYYYPDGIGGLAPTTTSPTSTSSPVTISSSGGGTSSGSDGSGSGSGGSSTDSGGANSGGGGGATNRPSTTTRTLSSSIATGSPGVSISLATTIVHGWSWQFLAWLAIAILL